MAEKKNYWTQAIGTQDAIIQFGGVSSEKDVRSSFKVVALDGNHFFTMDQDGQRKGWSTLYSPGAVQVGAGLDLKEDDNAIFVDALNGDIIIKAANGRIKLEGDEIDLKAKKSIVIDNSKRNLHFTPPSFLQIQLFCTWRSLSIKFQKSLHSIQDL